MEKASQGPTLSYREVGRSGVFVRRLQDADGKRVPVVQTGPASAKWASTELACQPRVRLHHHASIMATNRPAPPIRVSWCALGRWSPTCVPRCSNRYTGRD